MELQDCVYFRDLFSPFINCNTIYVFHNFKIKIIIQGFNRRIPSCPVNPLCSISVEEQFYILIPTLAGYGGRLGLKFASFLFLGIAYIVIINYGSHPTSGFSGEWTNSFVQFQFFSAGILLSLVLKGRCPQWPIIVRICTAVAALGC